ncbi:Auxin_repressed domain-containing protein [Cephalotus follicularis]|uniref:Auxin_repressed domain-containing protein n=1 Tax=Cephalotus follicularis TaxID=3775 RepID=A0A1Q3B067_CEPFO|nr:Auxin_repressed domain-containing protein [Cephalotus follicularis]
MGFLHKLWDETLAGPAPETGLGKLRKYDSFSATRSPPMVVAAADDDADHNHLMITRSITILRSNSSNFRNFSGDSVPASPASTTTTPRTPLSSRK